MNRASFVANERGLNTLIFDCDGVLADTERYGHLPAFNLAFTEFGLPLRWSDADYAEKLAIAGGKERLASAFTPELMQRMGIANDAERGALIVSLHAAKTAAFTRIVESGELPVRPGVARLAREAAALGWKLAVASTSTRASVLAVLDAVVGAEFARRFEIFTGDVVPQKKPAPDIYELAVERLGVDRRDVLAIEDSRNGLLAATAAGLACLVTLSAYTQDEPMDEAMLVVSSLGEPDGPATEVLANRSGARIGRYVTLDDLRACVESYAHKPSTLAGNAKSE